MLIFTHIFSTVITFYGVVNIKHLNKMLGRPSLLKKKQFELCNLTLAFESGKYIST